MSISDSYKSVFTRAKDLTDGLRTVQEWHCIVCVCVVSIHQNGLSQVCLSIPSSVVLTACFYYFHMISNQNIHSHTQSESISHCLSFAPITFPIDRFAVLTKNHLSIALVLWCCWLTVLNVAPIKLISVKQIKCSFTNPVTAAHSQSTSHASNWNQSIKDKQEILFARTKFNESFKWPYTFD